MSLKANYEFLFFGRDENSFLENYSFDLFKDHGEQSGQIFINLEIQNNPVDAESIALEIFETMKEVFFEDVNADPYERFEIALKEVNLMLNDFKKDKASGYLGDINAIISAVVGNTLYLTQSGEAEAYLIRKRFVSIVSDGLSDAEDEDLFTNIASGDIESGDFVLFASTRLLRYIGQNDLARSINPRSFSKSLYDIQDVISTEILGKVGLIGMSFNEIRTVEEDLIRKHEDSMTENILHTHEDHTHHQSERLSGEFVTGLDTGSKMKSVRKAGSFVTSTLYSFKKLLGSLGLRRFGNKNGLLVVLVLFIVVLVAGIYIANSRNEERMRLEALEEQLNGVEMNISEAETISITDKAQAVQLLDQANENALEVLNSGDFRERAHMALSRIEQARDRIDNVERIEDPSVLVDLAEVAAGIEARGFVELGDQLYVYDDNRVMEVLLDTNFIISCVLKRIDFIPELESMGFRVVMRREVLEEMKDLRKEDKTSHRERQAIDVAFQLLEESGVKKVKVGGKYVDDGLVKKANEGAYIATLDRELKHKVANRVLIDNAKECLKVERD